MVVDDLLAGAHVSVPPLCITEEQMEEGIAIIDQALEITDKALG